MKFSRSISLSCFIGAACCGLLTGCDAPPSPGGTDTRSADPSHVQAVASSVSSSTAAASSSLPRVIDYGPRDIQKGVAFNKQPDGKAAVWARMSNTLEGTDAVIQINGAPLQSSIQQSQITALVPDALYAKPGDLELSIVQHKNGKELRSGPVKMTVH